MQNRAGLTVVTSCSLTPQIKELMERFNISPTEAMRRGVAVILCEQGHPNYDTLLNKERLEKSEELYQQMQREIPDISKLQSLSIIIEKFISMLKEWKAEDEKHD